MSALVPRKAPVLAGWREPALDHRLERAIHMVLNPHPDVAPQPWPRAASRAAQAALEDYRALLLPADANAVMAWLWPLADAVAYTPTEDEFLRRVNAVTIAAAGLPHAAFNQATQRQAMATFDRMPSAAQVLALLTPSVQPMLDRVVALQHIAKGT